MARSAEVASSVAVSERMQRQRSRDTGVELALRSELHRRGLRYRVHRRPLPGIRREADIVIATLRLAVFVDGCFWHGCPLHATWPKANEVFWRNKIERNRDRDRDTDQRLEQAGWTVVRIWEHEEVDAAADRVMDAAARIRTKARTRA
jgi:DNA mismatch endonuclease (patch repair protein)